MDWETEGGREREINLLEFLKRVGEKKVLQNLRKRGERWKDEQEGGWRRLRK